LPDEFQLPRPCCFFVPAGYRYSIAGATVSRRSAVGEAATAPVVKKVEPPNWWIGLTPDLMVLLSGQRLQATKVACNLPDVIVGQTEATQGGDYLSCG